jgi:hypothetical protein
MEPVTVTCESACTVTHVISVQADLIPFSMDAEAGAQIAVAVAAIWLIGWVARMLIRAANSDSVQPSTEERE